MGLWGKDGVGEERDIGLWGKGGFEREKYTGGGHGRGKQELIGEKKKKRVKEIEMRFWSCAVDIFNINVSLKVSIPINWLINLRTFM